MKKIVAAVLLLMSMCASAEKLVVIFNSADGSTRLAVDVESFDGTKGTNFSRVFLYSKGKRNLYYASVKHDECESGAGTVSFWASKNDVAQYAWSLYEYNSGKVSRAYDNIGISLCVMGGQIEPEQLIDYEPDNKPTSSTKPKVKA